MSTPREYDTKIEKTDGVKNWRSQVATLVYPEKLRDEVDTVSRRGIFKQDTIETNNRLFLLEIYQ